MSDRQIYFGNRRYMQWIAAPEAGSERSSRGLQQSGTFLHGGAYSRRTLNAARFRTLSWALHGRDVLRPVTDYYEGVYGDGPIYWLDPFDSDRNMLAQSFATPSLGAHDAISLTGARPELIPTSSNPYGYPVDSAVYTTGAREDAFKHWIPVPAGYTAWVGAHGDVTSETGVTVRTKNTEAIAPVMEVNTDQRFNASFPITGDQDGVELSIESDLPATVILAGVMVQVLPTGTMPETGGFISGQGHTGMEFEGYPTVNAYSAAMDLVGVSANFVETEQWR